MREDKITIEGDYGEVALVGEVVSVKITPDRRVWVRWEARSSQYRDTGRKVNKGLSRTDKQLWLFQYRNAILERFHAEGYNDSDVEHLSHHGVGEAPHGSALRESDSAHSSSRSEDDASSSPNADSSPSSHYSHDRADSVSRRGVPLKKRFEGGEK